MNRERRILQPERQEQEQSPAEHLQSVADSERMTQRALLDTAEYANSVRGRMAAALMTLFISGGEVYAAPTETSAETTADGTTPDIAPETEPDKLEKTAEALQQLEQYKELIDTIRESGITIELGRVVADPDVKITPEEAKTVPFEYPHEKRAFVYNQPEEELEIAFRFMNQKHDEEGHGTASSLSLPIAIQTLESSMLQAEIDRLQNPTEAGKQRLLVEEIYDSSVDIQNGSATKTVRNIYTGKIVFTAQLVFTAEQPFSEDRVFTWAQSIAEAEATAVEEDALQTETFLNDRTALPEHIRVQEGGEPNIEIQQVLEQYDSVTIWTKSYAESHDSLFSSTKLVIDSDFVERTGAQPLKIDAAYVERIVLDKRVDDDTPDGAQLFAAPTYEQGSDHFGTDYIIIRGLEDDGLTMHEQTILFPPMPYGEQAGTTDDAPFYLDSDGSPVTVTEYFAQPTLAPVFTAENGLHMYSGMSADALAELQDAYEPIAEAAQEVCDAFGVPMETCVQQAVILESDFRNAHFHPYDPHSIRFQDEILRGTTVEQQKTVSRHETIHLVDELLDLSKESIIQRTWSMQMDSFNRENVNKNDEHFLTAVKESNWLPEQMGIGGHPWDNPAEWTATLINSLQHPEWNTVITSLSDDHFEQYNLAIDSLYFAVLIANKKNGEINMPIAQTLSDKREALYKEKIRRMHAHQAKEQKESTNEPVPLPTTPHEQIPVKE